VARLGKDKAKILDTSWVVGIKLRDKTQMILGGRVGIDI
jgi:hypothetical protein